jgi:nucleoside-diphosphate-sugar epimerase
MKVLITGACGHIGSFVAENIHKIKSISKAILVDNLKSNRFNSLYNLERKNNLSFFLRDLNNLKTLNDFHNVDVIIHCASMTNAEKSFGKEKEMYKNNLNCLKTVMKYCKNRNTKLIHLSSTSVYGKQTDLVDENCEKKFLRPQSPYAEIKLIEEKLLKKNSNKLRYNTFRFGTITGVSKGIRFHTAVNKFCFNAAIGEKIEVYKTALHQYRPYLSIRDSFDVFKFCLEKNFFENDIFNILSGNFTVNQILNKIKKINKKIKIVYVNSPIMNQLSYHVDDQKIKNKGLVLKSNIDVDIKDTLSLFKYLKNEM